MVVGLRSYFLNCATSFPIQKKKKKKKKKSNKLESSMNTEQIFDRNSEFRSTIKNSQLETEQKNACAIPVK